MLLADFRIPPNSATTAGVSLDEELRITEQVHLELPLGVAKLL
jgi:hypothetical protein